MKRPWILVLLLFVLAQPSHAKLEEITRFFVVRHAEKTLGEGDVHLSPRGAVRAQELVDALQRHQFSAVYSTDTNRTKETAEPLAKRCGLDVGNYPANGEALQTWASQALTRHRGKNVLIVGHSNTVPEVIEAFSGREIPPMEHDDYDDLFEVILYHDDTTTIEVKHHHYGALDTAPFPFIQGNIFESSDLSAVVNWGDGYILGSDEGAAIQQVRSDGTVLSSISLHLKTELDLEGLASDKRHVYAVGSHSKKRKKVEPGSVKSIKRSYEKNRARLQADAVKSEVSRHGLYRLKIEDNSIAQSDVIDLYPMLEQDPVLAPFTALASKENGVDIEGLAHRYGSLYVGFRGPVLRSGFVPVIRLQFDKPEDYELLFLPLDGRGIRSLITVSDGFLVLAGPVGDSDQSFRIYHWDGNDCVPGARQTPQGQVRLLGTVPNPSGTKAEGMASLGHEGGAYLLFLISDGIAGGSPQVLAVPRSTF